MSTAPVPSRPAPPFFIVGFQRSGTTLLRLMLDSHPDVAVPLDVVGLWARYARRVDGEFGGLSSPEDVRRLVEALLAEERIGLWNVDLTADSLTARIADRRFASVIEAFNAAYAAAHGKHRWGNKDPGDMLRIPLIDDWFPEARFVHIVRDGRDACLSLVAQDFGPADLMACADAWREQVWWVRRMGALLGSTRYHELRYEDLVTRPEETLRPLCTFLDLEFHESMLTYHRRVDEAVPKEKRHIWPMLDKPPQADNVARWKRQLSKGQRICFEKRSRDVLEEVGYEVLGSPPAGAYGTEIAFMLARTLRALRARLS